MEKGIFRDLAIVVALKNRASSVHVVEHGPRAKFYFPAGSSKRFPFASVYSSFIRREPRVRFAANLRQLKTDFHAFALRLCHVGFSSMHANIANAFLTNAYQEKIQNKCDL